MLISKRIEFSASHFCRNATLSEEENRRVFGAAANPHGHGHNYLLDVTLDGRPDPITGMVIDLKELKEILNREVIEPLDHRFLNHEVTPFDRVIPTPENIAMELWKRLANAIPAGQAKLHSIRLYETSDLYVEYFGDGE